MGLYHFFATGPMQRPFEDVRAEVSQGVIFYEDLWALFRPNEYVISKDSMGNHMISRISSTKWDEDNEMKPYTRYRWYLNLTRVNWMQGKFHRRMNDVRLGAFSSPMLVQYVCVFAFAHS